MIGWWLLPLAGGGSTHDLTRPLPDDRTETSRRVGHPPEKIMIPLRSCKNNVYRVEYEDRSPSETAGVRVGCVRRLKRWLRCATCNRWAVFTRPGARMKRKENDCKFHAGGFQATLSRANSEARLGHCPGCWCPRARTCRTPSSRADKALRRKWDAALSLKMNVGNAHQCSAVGPFCMHVRRAQYSRLSLERKSLGRSQRRLPRSLSRKCVDVGLALSAKVSWSTLFRFSTA